MIREETIRELKSYARESERSISDVVDEAILNHLRTSVL